MKKDCEFFKSNRKCLLGHYQKVYCNDACRNYYPAPEQEIKLADCNNMLKRIAEVKIKLTGQYDCMIDGKRTRVIP